MNNINPFKLVGFGLAGILFLSTVGGSFYTVDTGEVAIERTFGKASNSVTTEGLNFKMPFFTDVTKVNLKQSTNQFKTIAYTSDLQQVDFTFNILTSIPSNSAYDVATKYNGNVISSLVVPRVVEALKEIVSKQTAEQAVKNRETIKNEVLEVSKRKIGSVVELSDIVIVNIDLTDQLERAIEEKMVQEQEASKAKFVQQKAEIEAKTKVIEAEGEAKAIAIKGRALQENQKLVDYMIIEKWNGVSPSTVVAGKDGNFILPLGK